MMHSQKYGLTKSLSIREFQEFINRVYGLSNDRNFELWDMVSNVERFTMRALKGIRKGNLEKTKTNLLISFSWFSSLMNRLHINLEEIVWNRFPRCCSYCAQPSCVCRKEKGVFRQQTTQEGKTAPATLAEYQQMFHSIYPPNGRSIEHAGVHLAEEIGEFSEAIMTYRGNHSQKDFEEIKSEAADIFSCIMGIFNSMNVNMADELAGMFAENCHICHSAPCQCTFEFVTKFNS